MELIPAFTRCRKLLERSLADFFEDRGGALAGVNRWGRDLPGRLLRFSLNGKMIRGSLVILAYGMFPEPEKLREDGGHPERGAGGRPGGGLGAPAADLFPNPPRWVADVAAAYELIHSSLLVHDDIMDRDRVRRGEHTIFHQYEELARSEGAAEPGHVGTSLGICAGDVGFFLAFEMLSSAAADRAWKILRLWAEELTAVGLAQMEDVAFGASSRARGEQEILNLYRYKTARYTFSLPLATGALAAGREPPTVTRLEELGEQLGVLFQMKDDEIGLFGDETEIGKPPGSDIEEGKQTLLAQALAEKGGGEYEKIAARMRRRFENDSGGRSGDRPGVRADLASLRALAEKTGVLRSLERIREPARVRAEELIESLGVGPEHRNFLRELLRYNLERRR
jgi:geranylgeranyl diphosphate synthase type I